MINHLMAVKDRINGAEAENFAERYYGKCFSGRMSLVVGDVVCTYSISRGKIVQAERGIPWDGYDVGVKGSAAAWKSFATSDRKSLSRSTIWPKGESLELMGKPLTVRQSFGALAYLCKVFGDIIEEEGVCK